MKKNDNVLGCVDDDCEEFYESVSEDTDYESLVFDRPKQEIIEERKIKSFIEKLGEEIFQAKENPYCATKELNFHEASIQSNKNSFGLTKLKVPDEDIIDIIEFLKQRYDSKKWNIKDYKNITNEERKEISNILAELFNHLKENKYDSMPQLIGFHGRQVDLLKRVIMAVPILYEDKYNHVKTKNKIT
ncbi:MAG: hypothetical protein EU535_08510, partial [Promethearchaeota archaeon]